MSSNPTIGSSLHTLEGRISILIHYKLGKRHKIQSPLVGLNIPTHQDIKGTEQLKEERKK